MATKTARFSSEQVKLIVKTCLPFDAEIRECNEKHLPCEDLWKKITDQILLRDAKMKKFTREQFQQKYNDQREWYEKVKKLQAQKKRPWSAQWKIHADVYELFKKHDGAKTQEYSNELKEFILKARLALEAEFQECPKRDPQRTILWQKVLRQVNAKDVSKAKLTLAQVQSIYADFLNKYKNIKSGAEANGSSNVWPYFEQIDQVYGNYALDSIIVEEVVADIDDDDEDEDFESEFSTTMDKTYDDNHEDELDIKMDYDEFGDDDDDIDGINDDDDDCDDDNDVDYDYDLDQSDNDSNLEEDISTVSDSQENGGKLEKKIKNFLAEQAAADRKIFQQIIDIENEKVKLQKEKLEELTKLRILLEKEDEEL